MNNKHAECRSSRAGCFWCFFTELLGCSWKATHRRIIRLYFQCCHALEKSRLKKKPDSSTVPHKRRSGRNRIETWKQNVWKLRNSSSCKLFPLIRLIRLQVARIKGAWIVQSPILEFHTPQSRLLDIKTSRNGQDVLSYSAQIQRKWQFRVRILRHTRNT
jgi:hypothetical protein